MEKCLFQLEIERKEFSGNFLCDSPLTHSWRYDRGCLWEMHENMRHLSINQSWWHLIPSPADQIDGIPIELIRKNAKSSSTFSWDLSYYDCNLLLKKKKPCISRQMEMHQVNCGNLWKFYSTIDKIISIDDTLGKLFVDRIMLF